MKLAHGAAHGPAGYQGNRCGPHKGEGPEACRPIARLSYGARAIWGRIPHPPFVHGLFAFLVCSRKEQRRTLGEQRDPPTPPFLWGPLSGQGTPLPPISENFPTDSKFIQPPPPKKVPPHPAKEKATRGFLPWRLLLPGFRRYGVMYLSIF